MNTRNIRVGEHVIAVIEPGGRFTIEEENEYTRLVKTAVDQGVTLILVIFTSCKRIDSAAVGCIVRTYTTLYKVGGELRLCCMSKQIEQHFTLTKLKAVLDIHETEEEALGSFKLLRRPA